VVESTRARLTDGDYLSDARFAESFVRMRVARGDTPWLAAARARQRGVSESLASNVCQEALAGYDAHAACESMVNKRDPKGMRFKDRKVWNRQFRYLKSKGFDSAVVLDVLKGGHDAED
jgi:regulatory protein